MAFSLEELEGVSRDQSSSGLKFSLEDLEGQTSSRTTIPSEGQFQGSSLYKDLGEAVPFWTAPSEFQAGVKSGQELFSPAVTGNTIASILDAIPYSRETLSNTYGGTLGAARALATVLNPVSKTIGFAGPATQAVASAAGGDTATAIQDILGARPVQSAIEIPNIDTPFLNVPVNTVTQALNEAFIKQPLSPLGLTRGALADTGAAFRNFPRNVEALRAPIATAATDLGRRVASPFRSSAPVDPVAIEAATKNLQNLISQMETETARREAIGGERSARELILQEEIYRAEQEANNLGQQALEAGQELGPQIEALLRSAEQADIAAQGVRGRLPAPEEPSQFGRSMEESAQEATGKARVQATEDYTAVKESVGESQPKFPSTNVELAAENISNRKAQGYSAALQRTLKSVLGESSRVKSVDPLSGLSEAARDIYERLPESQKQSFLDQAGIDLAQTKSKAYTWDQLQQRYQDLNRFIEEARAKGNSQDAAAFQELKNATTADMNAYAEAIGTDTKALFDEANARFAANKQILDTSLISKISAETSSPALLVDKIVGNSKAAEVNNLKQILSPEKFQEVQSQYAKRLMSPAKDVPFDANHFIKQFDAINNETLKSVFGEEGFAELKKIDQLSKDSIKVQELQKTLDDFNSKAQSAQDAYQKAKTSAEKSRILESEKIRAEEAINEIKDQKYNRDVERAISDLKKAQTPERVSLILRALYGLLSFGGFAVGGAPVAGIAAGLAAAALGRVINKGARSTAAQITKALEKK